MKGLVAKHLNGLSRPDLLENRAFIAGIWHESDDGIPVVDPATGEYITTVSSCSDQDIENAVEVAGEAFVSWKAKRPAERGAILRAWANLMRSNISDLAVIMSSEQGKPLVEAKGEIQYGAAFLDWFAAEGERTYGETIPSHLLNSRLSVEMQPIGVTAAITPWNFPSAMITRKAGAALAAGCTMIVKPAPETPLSALALAKLSIEAGVPAGVFQVITGPAAPVSMKLMACPEIRAFSFTGSTEVGRILLKASSDTVKKVSMELGGHAPFIVFDDVDLESAVRGCINAKFATSGQDCLAANRIYVQRAIYNQFVDAFGAATSRLKVGHGLDPESDIGPMTRNTVARKCALHIKQALEAGAVLVTGGQASPLGENFVTPTVLANVNDEMLIAQEETFGPVAAILPFDTEQEVLVRANNTEMGLAAYVYTKDLNRATRLSQGLEYGMVGVNTASFTGAPIPFGGWKQSGLGREGSRHGILDYMQAKYVCIGNTNI
ncbi:NAD-dependent succinate-semialdehyde dehydrogenase [Pseudomonas fluorescens]|uniref:NAD-dependent succinate-semialdehyde dehydrogenase n=1 Tax=Pseudomonas fluorescens TaxID=294 RepID=A0A327NIU0_PSEFL|nr:NAD-dependent succinate-semialdehyde dehydrogenase [Pseudomonas fluorescens]RAI72468.1 NAD-dependent succinate-semialdehyde dehydrogenase [Pseudomonas fluorescens]